MYILSCTPFKYTFFLFLLDFFTSLLSGHFSDTSLFSTPLLLLCFNCIVKYPFLYYAKQHNTSPYYTLLLCTYYREAYRNGTLTSEGVRRVLKLDPNKMGKIADFFVREIAEAVPRVPINFQDKNTISGNGTGSFKFLYFNFFFKLILGFIITFFCSRDTVTSSHFFSFPAFPILSIAPPPTQSDKNNSSTSGSITATTNGRPGQPVRQGKVKGKTNKGGRPKRKLGEEGTLDPVDSEICDDEEDTMSYSNSSNIMDVEP